MVSGLPTFSASSYPMEIENSKNPLTILDNFIGSALSYGSPLAVLHKERGEII